MGRFLSLSYAVVVVLACLATPAEARKKTVIGELKRLEAAGAIATADYQDRRAAYEAVKDVVKKLPGRRRIELAGVVRDLEAFAANGSLTASRIEPLWLTLQRNREWWSNRPLLGAGARVTFPGSELLWQYVPGHGLQLHPLANFGRLNALWSGKLYDDRLRVLLDELLAIAVDRAGGVAWEYYWPYAGGRPPWVSALAQGTALQALARAGIRLGRRDEVVAVAREGLTLFETEPPAGVRVPIGTGAHYALYSFRPRLRVLNGFIQSLVGLYDFAGYANDDRARELFADGERVARREVPTFDTGAWSLYSRLAVTRESDLGYHRLVRGFLSGLCTRTSEPVYCDTAANFRSYETQPPVLGVLTERVRGGKPATLRFELSKISRVTVSVVHEGKVVFSRGPTLMGYGTRSIAWTVPRKPVGDHEVRLSAVDLAGNAGTASGPVEVLKPLPKKKKRRT